MNAVVASIGSGPQAPVGNEFRPRSGEQNLWMQVADNGQERMHARWVELTGKIVQEKERRYATSAA